MHIDLDELMHAIELLGFGGPNDAEGYLCRQTGAILLDLGDVAEGDDMPLDVTDDSKYVPLHSVPDLGTGPALALSFTDRFLPSSLSEVREYFRHRGAYARFKRTLEEAVLLDEWFKYEEGAKRSAVKAWLRGEGIALDD